MSYNNKHRQFLQYFMQGRIVSESEAKVLSNTLFTNQDLEDTIELVNSKIIPLELKINKVVCEQNGDISYVFVAMFVNDFIAKPDPNKALFVELVNYIIASGGSVPFGEVVKFNNRMTVTQLEVFFTHKYLIVDKNNNIFLSPLAINELEAYLTKKYVDRRCSGCLNVVVYGIKCNSCEKLAHGHCLKKYFQGVGSEKCPNCSKQIRHEWNPLIVFNELSQH